jgi:VanZ family protein
MYKNEFHSKPSFTPGGGLLFHLMIKNLRIQLRKWGPALLMMMIIFWFSSQPSSNLPNFDWADKALKKGGHMLGYAMLTWSYWYALRMKPNQRWLAWLFAILYAVTDEYHQSFVTGRYPSAWDVFVFDNLGALITIWWVRPYEERQPAQLEVDRLKAQT